MIEIKIQSEGFNSSYDITELVEKALTKLEKPNGIAKICVVGSTVGLTVMRYEPGAINDLLDSLEMVAPRKKEYEHFRTTLDPNGFAHIRSSLLGTSVMVPYKEWLFTFPDTHRIVLFDFDLQASTRTIYVDV
ncbi:YjbQ family protein [Geobacillus stearothermophilus]|uniref:YjbQ family protein n=1 Tax=Geobacillus stearothermophilus TaxID=1422 RepID=UPI003D1CDD7C